MCSALSVLAGGGIVFLVFGVAGAATCCCRLLAALAVGAGARLLHRPRSRRRRLAKFEEQLPDAIDLFTRTMRAGHNIHSGLETIATETADPVRMEFKKLMEELALGSQVEPALHGLGERVPLIDLKFFITGLILQRQTGANMVAVLENLSTLVRERLNMAAKLKAHTAQQRFSAGLLCALPLVVGPGLLDSEARIRPAALDRSGRQQVLHLRHHLRDRRHPGDPQDRQYTGMRSREHVHAETRSLSLRSLSASSSAATRTILFFVAAHSLLLWSGIELFRNQEDPLGDRLEELQSQALVVAQRDGAPQAAAGLDRILSLVACVARRRRLDSRHARGCCSGRACAANMRHRHLPHRPRLLFALLLLAGRCSGCSATTRTARFWAALVAACILGFMLPKWCCSAWCKRYRRKLQEALPDTVDLLGIVLGTGLALDQAMMRVSEEMQYIYPELAGEFATVVMQVRAGQERTVAFQQFVRRTGIEDIKSPRRHDRPEREVRHQPGAGAESLCRCAAHAPPPARRSGGGQSRHQDAVPDRDLHSAGALRHHAGSRHAERPEGPANAGRTVNAGSGIRGQGSGKARGSR